jgi:hypothetical protein
MAIYEDGGTRFVCQRYTRVALSCLGSFEARLLP